MDQSSTTEAALNPTEKPARSLLHTTSLVAVMTTLSRILGFLRDLVIAQVFGASAAVDAFLVAFRIPNLLRRLFAEGAFSQAFVPVLAHYRNHGKFTTLFLNQVATALTTVLFWVTAVGILLAPLLVLLFAPGFESDPTRYGLASVMLRITFPYLFFISLTAFSAAILNSYDRFGVAAFSPVLLNVAMIASAFLLRDWFSQPIYALAVGVTIGGLLQLTFQYPFLKRMQLWPSFLPEQIKASFQEDGVRRVLRLMGPAIFGVSVAQVNLLIDTLFASFLVAGSVSWLYFSDRMIEFPLGVFGVALATVSLPRLSRFVANKEHDNFNRTLDWGMRTVILISLPCALGLAILAGPILSTLFQYGKFDPHDVAMTMRSLIAFAVGLPAFMMVKILASAFYAHQDVRTPVKVGILAMVTNTVINLIVIHWLAHVGLALATTLAAYLNVGCLFWILRKRQFFTLQAHWKKFLCQIGLANVVMISILWWLQVDLNQWLQWSWLQRGLQLGLAISAAGVAYLAVLWLTGFDWRRWRQV